MEFPGIPYLTFEFRWEKFYGIFRGELCFFQNVGPQLFHYFFCGMACLVLSKSTWTLPQTLIFKRLREINIFDSNSDSRIRITKVYLYQLVSCSFSKDKLVTREQFRITSASPFVIFEKIPFYQNFIRYI